MSRFHGKNEAAPDTYKPQPTSGEQNRWSAHPGLSQDKLMVRGWFAAQQIRDNNGSQECHVAECAASHGSQLTFRMLIKHANSSKLQDPARCHCGWFAARFFTMSSASTKGLGHWSAHQNAKFCLEPSDDDQHCLLSNVSLQMSKSEVSNCHHSQLLEMTETR